MGYLECVGVPPVDVKVRGVDEAVWRRARVYCLENGKTLGELLSQALRVYLAARPTGALASSQLDLDDSEAGSDEDDGVTEVVHRPGGVPGPKPAWGAPGKAKGAKRVKKPAHR